MQQGREAVRGYVRQQCKQQEARHAGLHRQEGGCDGRRQPGSTDVCANPNLNMCFVVFTCALPHLNEWN